MHDVGTFTLLNSSEVPDADYSYGGAQLVPANSDPFAKFRKDAANITGFAEDTMILTSRGLCRVQNIHAGMLIHTRDHGLQRVLWSGRTDLTASKDLQPIVIPQGSIGNDSTLKVASHQGLLFTEWRASMFFGEPEVLVEAESLLGMSGIHRQKACGTRFHHLMLDQHALIHSNGAWTESLHPQDVAPDQFGAAALQEICSLADGKAVTSMNSVPRVSFYEACALQAA